MQTENIICNANRNDGIIYQLGARSFYDSVTPREDKLYVAMPPSAGIKPYAYIRLTVDAVQGKNSIPSGAIGR